AELVAIIMLNPTLPFLVIGAGLDGMAIWLFTWAAKTCRTAPLSLAFSRDEPEFIQRRGPYHYVRHPFYSSYIAAFIAGLVASGSIMVGLVVVPTVLIYVMAARYEERKFRNSSLAGDYLNYCREVGMFVPRSR